MTEVGPKYDIAISFLSGDESLAVTLSEKLSPMYNVFVFSKNQEEIAGADGLEVFPEVFRKDSRLVVVLYRDGWGKSKWTRVEETAIKDRCFNEGWDSLLFVSLSSESLPPKWLPETRIRLNYETYGFEQLIGVIKARVEEAGAISHLESAVDRVARLERTAAWKNKREAMLAAEGAVTEVLRVFEDLLNKLEVSASDLKNGAPSFRIESGRKAGELVVRGGNSSLTVNWNQTYGNSLDGAYLRVGIWGIRLLLPGEDRFYFKEPHPDAIYRYESDVMQETGWCWRSPSGDLFDNAQLAKTITDQFLDSIESSR